MVGSWESWNLPAKNAMQLCWKRKKSCKYIIYQTSVPISSVILKQNSQHHMTITIHVVMVVMRSQSTTKLKVGVNCSDEVDDNYPRHDYSDEEVPINNKSKVGVSEI